MSTETLHTEPSYPAKAGYPVRRSFSIHHQRSGILDHPLSRMMTAGCVVCSHSSNMHVSSRDALAPELCMFLRLEKQRAQGKPGARCTRSRACRVVSTRVSHHRFTGTPGLPCAMVLTVYFALSLVTGLSCHHRSQETCKQLASRELDASVGASGPHDFAVRAQRHSSFDSRRPSHPAPNVRDDRDTPLLWVRDSDRCKSDLGEKNTRIFLRKGLDTDLPSDARFKGGLFGRSRQSQKQDRV
jgi:hypothetical protein